MICNLNTDNNMQFVKESFQNCELIEATTSEWIVVANQSLANVLRLKNSSEISIFTWDEFLIHCCQSNSLRTVLSDFQTKFLWAQIIKNNNDDNLDTESIVFYAQQAWEWLHNWQLSFDSLTSLSPDLNVMNFVMWAKQFQQALDQNKSITIAQIPALLLLNLDSLPWPKKISVLGFSHFTPVQQAVFEAVLPRCHSTVTPQRASCMQDGNHYGHLLEKFSDTKTQWRIMAQWAKSSLANNEINKIGCLIPNLSQKYEHVTDIFKEVFNSDNFNIISNKRLINFPLISHALHFLKLLSDATLDYHAVTQLLLSPFVSGADSELSSRALLDFNLRKNGEMFISLREILALAKDSNAKFYSPILAATLEKFIALKIQQSSTRTIANWADLFEKTLSALGWPGDRDLSLSESHILENWHQLLQNFRSVNFLATEIDLIYALQLINELAKKTTIYPENFHKSIVIIDLSEAEGLYFDSIWCSDMDENVFSFVSSVNPFIPFSLQRKSLLNQKELAKNLLIKISNNSKEVFYSYATDKVHSLLDYLPTTSLDKLKFENYISPGEYLFSQRKVEAIIDNYSPKMMQRELLGGVQMFKLQATCPFKAMVQKKLHTEKFPEPTLGLNPMERGVLVHHLMENIWQELKNSEILKGLSDLDLNNIIDKYIDVALMQLIAKRPRLFKNRFTHLEKQRLKKLTLSWLNYEKTRSEFSIIALEQEKKAQIGDFSFTVRLDRIDQLEDYSWAIIDYKTSIVPLNTCFGERITEPQLPIYYLIHNENRIYTVVFAQIVPKEMKFKGIAAYDGQLPHVKQNYILKYIENWSELKQFWEKNLLKIAEEIAQGYAVADPIEGKNTCNLCDFKMLCRKYSVNHVDEKDEHNYESFN